MGFENPYALESFQKSQLLISLSLSFHEAVVGILPPFLCQFTVDMWLTERMSTFVGLEEKRIEKVEGKRGTGLKVVIDKWQMVY